MDGEPAASVDHQHNPFMAPEVRPAASPQGRGVATAAAVAVHEAHGGAALHAWGVGRHDHGYNADEEPDDADDEEDGDDDDDEYWQPGVGPAGRHGAAPGAWAEPRGHEPHGLNGNDDELHDGGDDDNLDELWRRRNGGAGRGPGSELQEAEESDASIEVRVRQPHPLLDAHGCCCGGRTWCVCRWQCINDVQSRADSCLHVHACVPAAAQSMLPR